MKRIEFLDNLVKKIEEKIEELFTKARHLYRLTLGELEEIYTQK